MTTAQFLPQETIRRKRDGAELSADEIRDFVSGLTAGEIGEGQVAAFAMAVFFQGLGSAEAATLTLAMRDSGQVLAWPGLDRPVLDKHSTGGVGDKTSLPLAAILAACGAAVPMISGRGLGHTGGTLDKLDAIPGYNTRPDIKTFRRAVSEAGCAIVGQTADLAPADRRLYAIRDVTATVESIPLITASILSKKLAAGLQGLVMDVKVGKGAFMQSLDGARALAESIVQVAKGAGLPARALITDMNQVLGRTAGNALEVGEAVAYLTGGKPDSRLRTVVEALACELLLLGGLAADRQAAESQIATALTSGRAAEAFQKMVATLGGPANFIESPATYLPEAPLQLPIFPETSGLVSAIDVRALGIAIVSLGGGRRRPEDGVDPAVGLSDIAGLGEAVGPKQPLAVVHARNPTAAESVMPGLRAAFTLSDRISEIPDCIHGRVANGASVSA